MSHSQSDLPADPSAAEVATGDRFARSWPVVVASLLRMGRGPDVAEEAAAEAFARSLEVRPPPQDLTAWCITAGRRIVLDGIRRSEVEDRFIRLGQWRSHESGRVADPDVGPVAESFGTEDTDAAGASDERAQLMFLVCDPVLSEQAQLVVALRLVCGLSVAQIADHLGEKTATISARLTRAKKALRGLGRLQCSAAERARRLPSVLQVTLALATRSLREFHIGDDPLGDLAFHGAVIADSLCREYPDCSEVHALAGIITLSLARRPGRFDEAEVGLAFAEVDRSQWNRALIRRGLDKAAIGVRGAGPLGLLAAISGLHTQAATFADTDWASIEVIYRELVTRWADTRTEIAHLVAQSHCRPGDEGVAARLRRLSPDHRDAALALADLERRNGRRQRSNAIYRQLLPTISEAPLAAFVSRRISEL